MDFANWMKAIYDYGPFALVVIFALITTTRTRKAMVRATKATRLPHIIVYLLNWIVTVGLVVVVVLIWAKLNVPRDIYVIEGKITGLERKDLITSTDEEFFLRRVYGIDERLDYKWKYISNKKFSDSTEITFTHGSTPNDLGFGNDYTFIVYSDFYNRKVNIKFDSVRHGFFIRRHGYFWERLSSQFVQIVEEPQPTKNVFDFFIKPAYAQDISFETLKILLQSFDPIDRRNGRSALVKMRSEALPWIRDVLLDPHSSLELRYGVISALSMMKDIDVSSFDDAFLLKIVNACIENNPSFSEEAKQLFVNHTSWGLDEKLQTLLKEFERMDPNSYEYRNETLHGLAVAELSVLLTLGNQLLDDYIEGEGQNFNLWDIARTLFKRASGYSSFAPDENKLPFTSAYFAIARSYEVMAKFEQGEIQKKYGERAYESYDCFLHMVKAWEDKDARPDQNQIKHALLYLGEK